MRSEPITNYLAYLLAQANRKMTAQLESALSDEGVQIEHWRILEILSDEQGRSMGELAELVLMNHPALTKTIDRMVSRALVHRRADPVDSRDAGQVGEGELGQVSGLLYPADGANLCEAFSFGQIDAENALSRFRNA